MLSRFFFVPLASTGLLHGSPSDSTPMLIGHKAEKVNLLGHMEHVAEEIPDITIIRCRV